MSDNRTRVILSMFAALLVLFSLAWWWLVFGKITVAGTISPADAISCLAADSDLCQLAEALCTNDHLINIRWYAPEIFWAALAVTGTAAWLSRRPASEA